MKFNKSVPVENREILTEQLKKYKKEIDMTPEELKAVINWISKGRSPYDNGDYIYDENGCPMDFVNAMRFEQEQQKWWDSLTKEEQDKELKELHGQYDTESDEMIFNGITPEFSIDSDKELPFI